MIYVQNLIYRYQEHPWVTQDGKAPLITVDENCQSVVTEVTEEEIHNAIKNVASIFTVVGTRVH